MTKDFQPCEGCKMRGTCRSMRMCAGTVGHQVDPDVAAWGAEAEKIARRVETHFPSTAAGLRDLVRRVVAVRA